ncbi:MAG: Flp family type IVb pilin [Planctomycetes bacterium]|nr:Flp family type IVb pilin [Planctomycetota bacterium]
MRQVAKKIVSFLKGEAGPTAVEYAIILALIVGVCVIGVVSLSDNANATFSKSVPGSVVEE